MDWIRREVAEAEGVKARPRAFTLNGMIAVTALLAVATALIAFPLRRTRDRQMISAAREQVSLLFAALEAYRGVHYRFPDQVDELRTVGYSVPPSIVVCVFRHVPDARAFDDHIEVAVHHRGSDRAVVSRYPWRGGATEQAVEAACPRNNQESQR